MYDQQNSVAALTGIPIRKLTPLHQRSEMASSSAVNANYEEIKIRTTILADLYGTHKYSSRAF
jgi:hypothetical protein